MRQYGLYVSLMTLLASGLCACDGSKSGTNQHPYRRITPVRNSVSGPEGPMLLRGSSGDSSDILLSRGLDSPLEVLLSSDQPNQASWGIAVHGTVYFAVAGGIVSVFALDGSERLGTVSLPDSGMSRHSTSPDSERVVFWNETTGQAVIVDLSKHRVLQRLQIAAECEYVMWTSDQSALALSTPSPDHAPSVCRLALETFREENEMVAIEAVGTSIPAGSTFAGVWKGQVAWTSNGSLWFPDGEIGEDLAEGTHWIWALNGAVARYDGVRLTVYDNDMRQVVLEDLVGVASSGVPQLASGEQWTLALATHDDVLLVIAGNDGSVTVERRRTRFEGG